MTTLEILLLILGAVIFLASFIVPESKGEMEVVDKQLTQEQIQKMLKDEIKNVRSQVEDTVEETVNYSMEKTERALERLTNEKITAVSEYTDTVMTDIHKSHEEVMFLYDMLNNKHENLKETASEVSQTVKEVNSAVSEAEITKQEVTQATQKLDEALQNAVSTENAASYEKVDFDPIDLSGIERLKKTETRTIDPVTDKTEAATEKKTENAGANKVKRTKSKIDKTAESESENKGAETVVTNVDETGNKATGKSGKKTNSKKKELDNVAIQFTSDQQDGMNNNERILFLHKQGKSNIAIAKELGLGVGEVKLVIDLFKGI